jgi:hypothetical protein
VQTASFLQASLFTSVVAFGVAAMAFGLGALFVLVGFALMRLSPKAGAAPPAQPEALTSP